MLPVFGLDITVADSEQWEEITGKVGVNYHIDDDACYMPPIQQVTRLVVTITHSQSYDPETVKPMRQGLKVCGLIKKVQDQSQRILL